MGAAIGLHLTLVLPILFWKPSAQVAGPTVEQLSLISMSGKAAALTAPPSPQQAPRSSKPPSRLKPSPVGSNRSDRKKMALNPYDRAFSGSEPVFTSPKNALASSKPYDGIKAAVDLGAALRPKPVFDPPKDVEQIVIDILAAGSPPSDPQTLAKPALIEPALAAAPAGVKTCQIPNSLQITLQTSEMVRQALPKIPAGARSVANAVMLWDGRWVDQTLLGGPDAVGPIQQAVLQDIIAAPPSCQTEIVRGPRLITIGDAQHTTVLAFGSGEWRWADLLSVIPPTQSENSSQP